MNDNSGDGFVTADLAPFYASLRSEPMPYIHHEGYVTGELMFLHFRDGKMLPANLALSIVSWPRSTFGFDAGKVNNGNAFLGLIKHTFALRRAGKQFLLPLGISYPTHLRYQAIDYSKYPPADEIDGASFWKVTVSVQGGAVKFVGTERIAALGQT